PIEVINKETSEKPPVLYDLTTLQREANKMYGLTAQQTLDVAQSLYEKHKATTYPRTDSQYLATNQKDDVKEVFDAVSGFKIQDIELSTLKDSCIANVDGNSIFNDKKISDHHAIIPTAITINLNSLSDTEKQIYLLVVARFYEAFLNPCLKHITTFNTIIKEVVFTASETKIKNKGWRILLPEKKSSVMLPDLPTGLTKTILDCQIAEGQTKPKA